MARLADSSVHTRRERARSERVGPEAQSDVNALQTPAAVSGTDRKK